MSWLPIPFLAYTVADLGGGGGGGGVQGVATPSPQKSSEPYIQNALLILPCTMSIVVVVVSSEQVIKPHSKQAVVKPEGLHLLECQLHVLELY